MKDGVPEGVASGVHCIQCGQDLYGIRADGNCPKCWTPVDRSLGALPKAVPDSAICVRCAYSLRGLGPGGVCPECGLPVERSLRGDLLLYSDPEYIRKLLAGSRLVLWSAVAIIFMIVAQIVLAIGGERQLGRAVAVAIPVANVVFCAGWWMLTWPDLGQLSTNKGQRRRRIVRVTSGVIIGFLILAACAPLYRGILPPEVGTIVRLLTYVAMVVGFWSGMLYVRWLAPRIPEGRINKLAKALLILFASMIGGIVSGGFLIALVASNHGEWACFPVLIFGGVALAGIASIIMYCSLFARLRAALIRITAAQREDRATSPRDSPAA